MSRSRGGRLDGGGDALVAAATTDVAAHRAVDLFLRRIPAGRKQRGGLHDLADLAISALRHIEGAPRFLHRVIALRIEPLDRGHRASRDVADGGDAGTRRRAVDMDGAGAAQGYATPVFCSGQTQFVPQIPEQWHRWIAIIGLLLAVDAQLDHGCSSRLNAGRYFSVICCGKNNPEPQFFCDRSPCLTHLESALST